MIEKGSHGSYTARVAKEIIEEHFKLTEVTNEDRTAISNQEQVN